MIQKVLLFILISTVILSPTSAVVTLTSPEQVGVNEEFEVSIEADTQEIRDVKIFVYEGTPQQVVSQIYSENAWKSGRYYIKNAYPTERSFSIRVPSFTGESEMCVQLRKPNVSAYSDRACNPIAIVSGTPEPPQEEEEEPEEEQKETIPAETTPSQTLPPTLPPKQEKISLNTPSEKAIGEFISPEERIRMNIVYIFAGICVLLIVLLSFKLI